MTFIRNKPSVDGYALGEHLDRFCEQEIEKYRVSGLVVPHLCNTCAFRKGTSANDCVPTIMDTLKSTLERDTVILCHAHRKSDDPPVCAGWMLLVRRQALPRIGWRMTRKRWLSMRVRAVLLLAVFMLSGSVALSAPAPMPRQKSATEQNRANLKKLAEALKGSKDAELKLIVPVGQKYIVPLQGRTLFYSATGRPSDTTRAVTGTPEGGGLWILGSQPGTATLGLEFAYGQDAGRPFKVFIEFHFTAKK